MTILPRKPSPSDSKHFKSSWQASTHRSFNSAVSWCGTHLADTYGTKEHHGRYGVLIHDSYPDVRLFHSLLRGDFPSRWLKLLQWPLVSQLGVPDQVEERLTELVLFMNFLVHSYTCCSDRHASPYWTFIRRWISMGFTPALLKKWMTECCSSLVHDASGAAIFTLLLCRRVAFLHLTTTCQPLFNPWVSLLSTYMTIKLCFKFLSHF